MTTIKINEQIAFLRKQKSLTQEELANALGVTNQAVSKWESAQCCPDIQLLPDLAKIFDVSIDELIGYKSTEGLGDICLKIKDHFSALPEKKAFENAYRIAALLHEIASTDGYKKTVPWKEKDYAADHISSWGLSICSEPEGCTGRKNNNIFFSLGKGYGGGIGANGALVIGTPDMRSFNITKQWDPDILESEKKAVTIRLKIGDYQLDAVILDQSNNWTASFTQLPDPETLLDGLTIRVEEEGEEYIVDYDDVLKDPENRTLSILITNHPKPTGGLEVSKIVDGAPHDAFRKFTFTVTLGDSEINGLYGDMEFTDGVASFQLRHGKTKAASGLPSGITYIVKETEANQDGFKTVSTGSIGTIPENETAQVQFKNSRPATPPDEPDVPDVADTPVDDTPKTGDESRLALWLSLTGLSALGMLLVPVYTLKQQRKKARH